MRRAPADVFGLWRAVLLALWGAPMNDDTILRGVVGGVVGQKAGVSKVIKALATLLRATYLDATPDTDTENVWRDLAAEARAEWDAAQARIAELERELAFERERDAAEDRERNALRRAEKAEAELAAERERADVGFRGRDIAIGQARERAEAAEARAAALAAGLQTALEDIEECLSYASPWAREKWNLEDGPKKIRALLAAGPSEAAAELAGLRAAFDACAPPCWYVFIPPLYELQACKRRATKRASKPHFDEGVAEFLSRDYCDEHAPEGATDLPWAYVVRARAGRGGEK
jgi:hypothetical protein